VVWSPAHCARSARCAWWRFCFWRGVPCVAVRCSGGRCRGSCWRFLCVAVTALCAWVVLWPCGGAAAAFRAVRWSSVFDLPCLFCLALHAPCPQRVCGSFPDWLWIWRLPASVRVCPRWAPFLDPWCRSLLVGRVPTGRPCQCLVGLWGTVSFAFTGRPALGAVALVCLGLCLAVCAFLFGGGAPLLRVPFVMPGMAARLRRAAAFSVPRWVGVVSAMDHCLPGWYAFLSCPFGRRAPRCAFLFWVASGCAFCCSSPSPGLPYALRRLVVAALVVPACPWCGLEVSPVSPTAVVLRRPFAGFCYPPALRGSVLLVAAVSAGGVFALAPCLPRFGVCISLLRAVMYVLRGPQFSRGWLRWCQVACSAVLDLLGSARRRSFFSAPLSAAAFVFVFLGDLSSPARILAAVLVAGATRSVFGCVPLRSPHASHPLVAGPLRLVLLSFAPPRLVGVLYARVHAALVFVRVRSSHGGFLRRSLLCCCFMVLFSRCLPLCWFCGFVACGWLFLVRLGRVRLGAIFFPRIAGPLRFLSRVGPFPLGVVWLSHVVALSGFLLVRVASFLRRICVCGSFRRWVTCLLFSAEWRFSSGPAVGPGGPRSRAAPAMGLASPFPLPLGYVVTPARLRVTLPVVRPPEWGSSEAGRVPPAAPLRVFSSVPPAGSRLGARAGGCDFLSHAAPVWAYLFLCFSLPPAAVFFGFLGASSLFNSCHRRLSCVPAPRALFLVCRASSSVLLHSVIRALGTKCAIRALPRGLFSLARFLHTCGGLFSARLVKRPPLSNSVLYAPVVIASQSSFLARLGCCFCTWGCRLGGFPASPFGRARRVLFFLVPTSQACVHQKVSLVLPKCSLWTRYGWGVFLSTLLGGSNKPNRTEGKGGINRNRVNGVLGG